MGDLIVLENKVLALLQSFAIDDIAKNEIAPKVAQKSMLQQHLYQDLGFDNRIQMGKFMQTHFPNLAKDKPKDKLWKKYIFDLIGEVAPACATCSDQINCFSCASI